MKKENTTQETQSNTEVLGLNPVSNDWKAIKEQEDKTRIINFREELKALQIKYGVKLVPQVTIVGTDIVNPLIRFILQDPE